MNTNPDDSVCARCGASEQATHHPLCQERDGTPTALSDEEVREAMTNVGLLAWIRDPLGLKH